MKRLAALIAILAGLSPAHKLDAGCRVNCQHVAVVEQVVAVPAAIVTGVPVATYAPTSYTYTPQPNITVNVQLDSQAIGAAVADKLNGPAQQPSLPSPPPVPNAVQPSPPPVQSMFAAKCAKCHQTADAATGKPSFAVALDCPTKLKAIQAIVTSKMPKGGTLTADEVGKLIEELSK